MKFIKFVATVALTITTVSVYAKSEESPVATRRPLLQVCEAALTTSHRLAFQFYPATPGKPTFLLLPGVNRSMLLSDPSVATLISDGAGVATFNFSVQPFSLAELPDGQSPDLSAVTLQSLANETMAIAKKIEKDYGVPLKELIPVTLSYSGAISPYLTAFPTVIDMVPLTSIAAYSPKLEATYRSLKNAELFNPIFGANVTRSSLDFFYRAEWVPQVDSIINQFDLPRSRRSEMVDGYLTLSRAVESFRWADHPPSKKVKRVFVLAENEAYLLLSDQIRTILDLQRQGYAIATIILANTGHIIPAQQPVGYVAALRSVAADLVKSGTVTLVDVNKNSVITVEGEQGVQFLKAILVKNNSKGGRSP